MEKTKIVSLQLSTKIDKIFDKICSDNNTDRSKVLRRFIELYINDIDFRKLMSMSLEDFIKFKTQQNNIQ